MAFASGEGGGTMADINVTPLVDVLLVLLIIFMVTAPLASYPVGVDLPQRTLNPPEPPKDPPAPIRLKIDPSGGLSWDNMPLPKSALEPSLLVEASRDPQPTLEVETSQEAQYQYLAEVLTLARNAGMEKIGFVETE